MFSRISYNDFQLLFPVIGFVIFATVFIGAVIRVSLMKKKNVHHLSSLPLEEDHFRSAKSTHHES